MKNHDQTEFTGETALAFFTRLLDAQKWHYRRPDTRPSIFSGFNGDDALWEFNLLARQQSEGLFLLGVSSFIPNKAHPDRRAACAELLSRINFQLLLGCFEMNHEDGEIRFQLEAGIGRFMLCFLNKFSQQTAGSQGYSGPTRLSP